MIIPIICGPTASGKTDLALTLSKDFDIEIVNADSRQIYKYFNIGTNKGKIIQRSSIKLIEGFNIPEVVVDGTAKGWLFDFLDPFEGFNVSNFQQLAGELIGDIIKRKSFPVIVGGTGLYIDSLVKNYQLTHEPNLQLRNELDDKSVEELQKILVEKGFDIESINNSDRNNKVRLIRFIEKLETNFTKNDKLINDKYSFKMFYPQFEREDLMTRINKRVLELFELGFVKEVEDLIDRGYKDSIPMKGIGYKEVVMYLDGLITYEECIKQVQISHRRYAKRQITWFEGAGRGYDLNKITVDSLKEITKYFFS